MRWALPLLALGCGPVHGYGGLPDGAVAVVSLKGGGHASVYVDLRRDPTGPRVRAATGVLALGAARATVLTTSEREGVVEVALRELGTARGAAVALTGPAELVALEPDGDAVLQTAEGRLTLSLDEGGARPGGELLPESRWHHGPGEGFHLRRAGDRLELLRPRGDDARWMPLLQGVDRLLGAWWVNSSRLPEPVREVMDARMKELVGLEVEPGQATPDGDLSEWRGALARPVERESQVLSGLDAWEGPRDAAFGMTARHDGDRLYIALRVRDDARVAGQDRLEILTADRVFRLVLPDHAGSLAGTGWEAAFSEPDLYGQGVELVIHGYSAAELREGRPVVQLVDVDPDEEVVRLGSAPSPALGSLAALPLSRGPLP